MRVTLLVAATYFETKAGVRHVRDPEFWGMPFGTPITPGMKPRGMKKPKGNPPVTLARTPKAKKVKAHPPYPADANQRYADTYAKRTSRPPRNSGKYEGMTAQEMWDDWTPERASYSPPPRGVKDTRGKREKKIGNAFEAYAGDQYTYVNGMLRLDEVATADLSSDEIRETANDINWMDGGVREIGKDVVVHRTTTAPVFGDLHPGAQFRDRGFVSTTVLEGYLDEVREELYAQNAEMTTMEIRVPAKTKGMYLSSIQSNRNRDADIGEGELLLERGTEFKVVERNGTHLILEVVLPGSPDATEYEDILDRYADALIEQKRAEEADEYGDEL